MQFLCFGTRKALEVHLAELTVYPDGWSLNQINAKKRRSEGSEEDGALKQNQN
jgi:hypothetical protein